jgi:glycine/serine hydroxymethyltransferase
MRQIARWIAEVLNNLEDEPNIRRVRSQVEALTEKFPLYASRRVAVAP